MLRAFLPAGERYTSQAGLCRSGCSRLKTNLARGDARVIGRTIRLPFGQRLKDAVTTEGFSAVRKEGQRHVRRCIKHCTSDAAIVVG